MATRRLMMASQERKQNREKMEVVKMKYADINKRFTEIVAEYLAKGYTINTGTMSGSSGEIAKVDITNGIEIVRITVNSYWRKYVEIVVGTAGEEITPHSKDRLAGISNHRLNIIHQEKFHEIGRNRSGEEIYGTEKEAEAAKEKRRKRYWANHDLSDIEDVTQKYLEIAKRFIRRRCNIKRVCADDVFVGRQSGELEIRYRGGVVLKIGHKSA